MVTAPTNLSATEHILHILRRNRVLGVEQYQELCATAFPTQNEFEKALLATYHVSDQDLFLALAEHASVPVLCLGHFAIRPELLEKIPKEMLRRNLAVPLAETASTLTVAIADPLNVMALEEIGDHTRRKILPVTAMLSEILEVLVGTDQGAQQGMDEILRETADTGIEVASAAPEDVDIDQNLHTAEEAPVIRLVNMILVEAIRRRASDIHIEPFEKGVRLRYRVDGTLFEAPSPPKNLQNAIISRIKVMSNLDIAERRIPQDGRFRIKAHGRDIDLRISILPTVHGEKVVMRLLDRTTLAKSLDELGLDPESLDKLRYAINQPHGLILVTGPTGSGKTTTLYSALQELNSLAVNIVTVENPVEYQIHGINQVDIRDEVNLTFANSLRSILRQDPDIVLVGETRDNETADIAVKAALTGHLVLTTLHTNDAPSAIARLVYMGIPNFLISSCLLMAQAQRLVRRICPNCKEPFPITKEYLRTAHIPEDTFEGVEVYHGRGCAKCNNTGYRGRASIMEILPVSPALREVILRSANADDIRKAALAEGFKDLRTHGFHRVREGITTIDEVLNVTTGDT
ncbi:MAG: ATPase, T2SS/T4P/T4SS family [Lentisphaeria bacterium]|jgi:type IV pilus assembly protein PilB